MKRITEEERVADMVAADILWHRGARHTASEKWRYLNRMTQPFLRKRRRMYCVWLSQ